MKKAEKEKYKYLCTDKQHTFVSKYASMCLCGEIDEEKPRCSKCKQPPLVNNI